MYNIGDYVIKIPEGICKVENVGHFEISGMNKNKEYYLLVPLKDNKTKIYMPVGNAEGRIRSVITKADAMKFIKSIPDIHKKDISNEKMREHEYREAILSGDNSKVVSLLKLIYTRKQERSKQGKKITATDDKYFKQAEDLLYSELSFVLKVPKENMEQFIEDTLNA